MTVGEVISVTYPDADVQGLVSEKAVFRHVHGLIAHRLSKDTSTARALRAQLRGALNREVGSVPAIWDLTLDKRKGGLSDGATRGEKAVHGALTLWAFHQGAAVKIASAPSDRPLSFASAIRVVAERQKGDKRAEETPIFNRFSAAVQAPTFDGLLVHLRSLVSQLKSAGIPCDYAKLAADLFLWQDSGCRSSVMRDWGRQFARALLESPVASSGE